MAGDSIRIAREFDLRGRERQTAGHFFTVSRFILESLEAIFHITARVFDVLAHPVVDQLDVSPSVLGLFLGNLLARALICELPASMYGLSSMNSLRSFDSFLGMTSELGSVGPTMCDLVTRTLIEPSVV